MALEENLLVYSYDAAGAIAQHRFVTMNTDGAVAQAATAGAGAFGVCLNKPGAAGDAVTVATAGQCMVEASAAIAAGDRIGMTADGRARVAAAAQAGPPAVPADVVLGIAVSAASGAGVIMEVMIDLPVAAAP